MTQRHDRRACVLIPLFSIRTAAGQGVGDVPDLARFARWAATAGFRVVQLLPVNEVRGGETSPYAAASAFALDPVYLGLDACEDLAAAGGLAPRERSLAARLQAAPAVDWGAVRRLKARALDRAFAHFLAKEWRSSSRRARELRRFREEMRDWIEDYALYAVLHDAFHKSWQEWPEALRDRQPETLAAARAEHEPAILYKVYVQWQLDRQWRAARAEAAAAGVDLMGDLPFVVAGDSADVWSRRDEFRVDRRVGTPPDAFSAEGQDWGLPLYDWVAKERTGFAWMRARAARAGELYALYRVDHVIGLYRTYYRGNDGEAGFTPDGEADQIRLGETLLGILGEAGEVVAEDLGMVPDFLRPSLERLGIPGYKVLRWEKDEAVEPQEGGGSRRTIVFRDPARWPALSVAASGTHDIETHAEWYDALAEDERAALARVPGLEPLAGRPRFDDGVRDALLRVLYGAPSELCAVPLQDALGSRERINVPGTVTAANWTWRMPTTVEALAADGETTARLARLAAETGRGPREA